jgi:hypothetical protein
MVKNKIGIQVVFNHITEAGLTPNQFYLLYCMNQSISAPSVNLHQELRSLQADGWIVFENTGVYKLQPKIMTLISKIDSYFGAQVKKSNVLLMGEDFETNALKYNETFPRMKLPSNKPARSPIKEVVSAFREFFKEHSYSWEVVHQAAKYYIEEEEKKGFRFTRTSRYFIRKQDQDKSWISDLAGYCELIVSGEDADTKAVFKTKEF